MKKVLLAVACILAVLPAPARAQTRSVTVANFRFDPQQTVAAAGDAVTWTWAQGSFTHNVTAEIGDTFASPSQSQGTFTATFDGGTVLYRCTIHSSFTAPTRCEGMCAVLTDDTTPPSPPAIDTPADGARPPSRTVTFSGSAGPGTNAVRLEENGLLLDEVFPSGGTWSTTLTLENGAHTVQAVAVDLGLNESAAVQVSFVLEIDTEPPTVIVEQPSSIDATVGAVTFAGEAFDDLAVAAIDITVTNIVTGEVRTLTTTCPACPGASVGWARAEDLGTGVYRAFATARDTAGRSSRSADVTFAVV